MSHNIAETIQYKNHTIKICFDEDPVNPRTEWENVGTLLCWHKRYTLGDTKIMEQSICVDKANDDYCTLKNLTANCNSWNEVEKVLVDHFKPVAIAPVYMYDHSGLRVKIGSFQGLLPQGHAEFDSGRIGFILVTRKAILECQMKKKLTKALIKKAEKIMADEIECYDDYLSGNCYGYIIGNDENDNIESCWGFLGDSKYCINEAKAVVDNIVKNKIKQHNEKLKAQIKNKVPLEYREPLTI